MTLEPDYGHPIEAVFPLLLIDDDQWLSLCESDQDLQLAVEPEFLDDIEFGFDALARPLELFAQEVRGGRSSETAVRVCGTPQPEALQRHVQKYFSLWTYGEAPEFSNELPTYISAVIAQAKTAKTRKKRNN